VETICDELRRKLDAGDTPDYITFSGSGEPTLYAPLGDCIDRIRSLTGIPVAVITNSTLLPDPEVRAACTKADLVIPSLDAADEATFDYINRPHSAVGFQDMVDALITFRAAYTGAMWLELFFAGGVNTTTQQADRLIELVGRIAPGRCQLNTVARPPACNYAFAANLDKLNSIARRFPVPAEIIADVAYSDMNTRARAQDDDVRRLVARRPCTIDDIARGLSIHRNEAIKHVTRLRNSGAISSRMREDRTFYVAGPASFTQ
jgi:wyosine [tRNA(Phe)-imidazoG37] synthetase (radical SAM superfamily)